MGLLETGFRAKKAPPVGEAAEVGHLKFRLLEKSWEEKDLETDGTDQSIPGKPVYP
jgi:hypothetical protein